MSQFLTITVSFAVGAISTFAAIGIFIAWQIHKALSEAEKQAE